MRLSKRFENLRLVATGDWHYKHDPRAGKYEEQRSSDLRDNLGTISFVSEERQCPNVCILGDIFDSPNPSSLERYEIAKIIRKFEYSKFINKIFVIAGNHDKRYGISAYSDINQLFPNDVMYILGEENDISYWKGDIHGVSKGLDIAAIPWEGIENQRKRLQELPKNCIDILLVHADISGKYMQPAVPSNSGLTSEELIQPLKEDGICLLGHYHVAQQWEYKGRAFAYVGAPARLNFNHEHLVPGFTIIADGELKFYSLEDREFTTIKSFRQVEPLRLQDKIDGNIFRVSMPNISDSMIVVKALEENGALSVKYEPSESVGLEHSQELIGMYTKNDTYNLILEYIKRMKDENFEELAELTKKIMEENNE